MNRILLSIILWLAPLCSLRAQILRPILTGPIPASGGGSWAFVQSKTNRGTSPQTVSFNGNPITGNTIVVAVSTESASAHVSTMTGTGGNTYTNASPACVGLASNTDEIWYAKNITGGAITITVTATSAVPINVYILEYSGLSKTAPFDAVGTCTGNTGMSNPASINVTTTASGDLLFGWITSISGAPTAGSGFTVRDSGVFNNYNVDEDMTAGSVGVNAVTFATPGLSFTTLSAVAFKL